MGSYVNNNNNPPHLPIRRRRAHGGACGRLVAKVRRGALSLAPAVATLITRAWGVLELRLGQMKPNAPNGGTKETHKREEHKRARRDDKTPRHHRPPKPTRNQATKWRVFRSHHLEYTSMIQFGSQHSLKGIVRNDDG